MSILSELKKLTGKQNAKVVSEALPDSAGSGVLIVVENDDDVTLNKVLDKTMGEIQTAYVSGRTVLIYDGSSYFSVAGLMPTKYSEKEHHCYGEITSDNPIQTIYSVLEATEEAAFAAYPSTQSKF